MTAPFTELRPDARPPFSGAARPALGATPRRRGATPRSLDIPSTPPREVGE